jgi:hypothetical protein
MNANSPRIDASDLDFLSLTGCGQRTEQQVEGATAAVYDLLDDDAAEFERPGKRQDQVAARVSSGPHDLSVDPPWAGIRKNVSIFTLRLAGG